MENGDEYRPWLFAVFGIDNRWMLFYNECNYNRKLCSCGFEGMKVLRL